MKGIRLRVENGFGSFGSWAFRHKFLTLALAMGIVVATALPVRGLRFETSMVSMFHEQDPARLAYEEFQDRFGKDDMLLIVLQTGSVFETTFLGMLNEIHRKLDKEVPYLDEITSLVNVRSTRGEEDRLVVEDLMKKVPSDPEGIEAFRNKVSSEILYQDFLVSRDGTLTTIVLRPKVSRPQEDGPAEGEATPVDTTEYIEMLAKVQEILAPYREKGVTVHSSGHPVLAAVLQQAMQDDLGRLMPLSILLAAILLAGLFRKITGVLFPLLVIIVSVASTLGTMTLFGIPMTTVTSGMFSFLVVMSIADSVHILTIFYRRYREGEDKHDACKQAFAHSGLPVLMTSLTTAAGLLSFAGADVAWVADLGVAAPLGVFFAFVYTMLLVPPLLAIVPVRRSASRTEPGLSSSDRWLAGAGAWSVRRAWWVILAWALVLGGSLAGTSGIRLSQNGMKWFPEDHPIREATRVVDQKLAGSLTFEIIVDTGKKDGLYNAKLMGQLERTARELEKYHRGPITIGKAMSVATLLKEVNRALNENRPEAYQVPDTDQLVAQELLLFEMSGSDDLEELISTDLRQLRLTLTVPFEDAVLYRDVLADLEAHFDKHYPDADVVITGINSLFIHTVNNILSSMAKSYPLALVVISLLMILMLGRLRIGLLSMVPNLVPIGIVVGWMGWLEIPFDFSTMLVGSVAIGLVVDDTIHFLHTFAREQSSGKDVQTAVRATLLTTGRAIFITSLTLAAGFFINATAMLQNLLVFGVLTGSTVLIAMLADFFLVPALLAVVFRKGTR